MSEVVGWKLWKTAPRWRRRAVVFVVTVIVAAATVATWAYVVSERLLARKVDVHTMEVPLPFPLSSSERAALSAEENADTTKVRRASVERAIARGRHLEQTLYACTACHGHDLGGGEMLNNAPVAVLLGPNITTGRGSRTVSYVASDWDRAVRHGVLPGGRVSMMPADDFREMSDQELSDLVMYIRSFPPINRSVPTSHYGPIGRLMLATGMAKLPYDRISNHEIVHKTFPPAAGRSVEFGQHLAAVCKGCHRPNLEGGPIPGAAPQWVSAANLTPHTEGLADWTYVDFERAMRLSVDREGRPLREPMSLMAPYFENLTETEMQALWLYVNSLPAKATGS